MSRNYLEIICGNLRLSSIRYFNELMPHQGIEGFRPKENKKEIPQLLDLKSIKYKKTKHLHGLFTEFNLVA